MTDSKENKKSLIASLLEEISPKESLRIENNMRIAANIADLLEKRGIGKVELARRLGKHPSVATKWLSGTHNFTTETLSDICFELGTTMPDIHKEKEQPVVSVRHYDVHSASPLAGIIPRLMASGYPTTSYLDVTGISAKLREATERASLFSTHYQGSMNVPVSCHHLSYGFLEPSQKIRTATERLEEMMHMLETKKPGNKNDDKENTCYA
jgi:transcriptional regulator with XRE-family HTH domain